MIPSFKPFASGEPSFDEPDVVRVLHEDGPVAAWRLAYHKDAQRAASKVRRDFSVALAEGESAFLAVDRFAVRTLCYRVDGDQLTVADRADQLVGDDAQVDPQAIYDYLFFHAIASPRTIFKDVRRLPPGHAAHLDKGRLTVEPYWQPHFDEAARPSFDSLRDEFMSLLGDAVRRRLDGSRPACFLSGGTDSSTVAGLVGKTAGGPAATYSIGFDAEGYDEMSYARIAAQHFGTDHHEYYVTPDDVATHLPRIAAHYDQPFGNSSALPAYLCQMRARDDGVTRMLAGDGGDELFGGNERYAMQRIYGWYQNVPARKLILEPLLQRGMAGRLPLLKKAKSYIDHAQVPLPDRLQMYNQLRRLGPAEVLTPAFLSCIDLEGPARQQREVWDSCPNGSELNRMLAFDWRYTLAENDLPKVCGMAQLAGMDVAFPLLDDALLDFSMRLPTSYKLKGVKLRWFFKEALRGFLPDEIIAKPKHGFGLPFGVWLTRSQALRAVVDNALDGLGRRGIVRREFIDRLQTTHMTEHAGYYGGLVWVLVVLELWLQAHAPSTDARQWS